MGLMDNQGDSHQQTQTLLGQYEQALASHQASIADNCIRTWFFVRDVDTQYHGLVVARRNYFNYIAWRQTHIIFPPQASAAILPTPRPSCSWEHTP